jgi:hypothetical protein
LWVSEVRYLKYEWECDQRTGETIPLPHLLEGCGMNNYLVPDRKLYIERFENAEPVDDRLGI